MIIDSLSALIILVMLLTRRRDVPKKTLPERMIHALMICCMAVLLLDIPGILLDGAMFAGARGLLWFFDTAYWLMHILYCWLWLLFVDCWCFGSGDGLKRRLPYYALPLLCETAILLANPWTGWVFTLDAFNVYAPGSAYQLSLLPLYAYIVASLAVAVCGYRAAPDPARRRRNLSLLAYMFLPICGVLMEILAYGISWVWPMVALSLLMVQLHVQQQAILDEQLAAARSAASAARMNAEMTNSRMAIMLSQIQPHFIYNVLCVIQDLCHEKAPEAEQATVAFSKFLRYNLDSLKADEPIPFSNELSHTQYYLTLEQMRFGTRLRVQYDLGAEAFRLPAMTLQPIVEYAVRYGVMKKEAGGTVKISTAEADTRYLVTVEDDGVGFSPQQKHADGRTHIGIDNVRQRLRDMCGGDLEIVSIPGTGTVATLSLPKGEKSLENPCD